MAKLIKIIGCDNPQRVGDVVFIHGLGGNGLETWHTNPQEITELKKQADKTGVPLDASQLNFWPVWLGKERPDLGIWSLDYEVEPSDWKGGTMPLAERANNVLETFANKRIGQRPLVFITHSLGGLLAKQLLRNANDFGTDRQRRVVAQTKGLVFLATPHSGSNWSNWAQFINGLLLKLPKLSLSVEELEYGHSRLQELNQVFRGHPILGQVPVKAYYETQPLKPLGVVVDKVSADMGKPEPTIPVDANHINICKISAQQREEGVVYDSVVLFLEDYLSAESATAPAPTTTTPAATETVDRPRLYGQLAALPSPQFGEIAYVLNPPAGTVPGIAAAQGTRVEALLNWAEGTGGCGLDKVQSVLDQILPPR
ncbi:MAG: esterase/lipase family protein [Leptolyngbyaceae cyanobacterium]